uniref:Integrin alpha-2 domain-containing protein n=1 Tax=Dendroctonus ponderosae TaxID=77166 RepID=A0AAR5QAR5_DENPD
MRKNCLSMNAKSVLMVICLHVLFMRTKVFCFNIEDRDPKVKKAPEGQKNAYFGFSVALHQTMANSVSTADNWLLVGAPLGQNLQPDTNYSGAVFKCPISELDQDCIQIETDGQRLNEVDYDDDLDSLDQSLLPPQTDEIKEGQWLGVSVKSQKPGGQVLVCAHRYIQSPDISKFRYGQGLCYLLNNTLHTTDSLQFCKGLPTEKLHQQYGFCQIGTSISFVGDSALVGAPGPYTWRGTLFSQVVEGSFIDRDKTIYRGPLNDNPLPIDKYSYLGMSVGGGHILSKSVYTYVSGAPRSQMVGQVYFFEKRDNIANEELSIPLILTGQQFASSFGYEVLVEDVNNDGFDDLLVGAPFYYADNKGGAVYVYYNLKSWNLTNPNGTWDAVFFGTEQSRFGFSMTSIGDINKDGYNDVAIGAPYERDHGAVYIYLGSSQGLKPEPSQIMRFPQLSTFGYSLSGGLDMDKNGYPDLLVGAYESERALLFLTRPIIDINIKIESSDMFNINVSRKGCAADPGNQNNTCFVVKPCFTIVGKDQSLRTFSIVYHITELQKIIPRIWFRNPQYPNKRTNVNTKTIEVEDLSKTYCQREVVYIKEGVSDILSPIKFKVKYTLEEDSKPHTAILNTTSIKEFEATFQKDCGDDDVCISYLELIAGTNFKKNSKGEYAVNMTDQEFVLEANISNKLESAYEAKLFVVHPTALSYINLKSEKNQHTNVKCSFKNQTLVVCDLGNPFRGNASVNLKLRFEIKKNTKDQTLDLMLKVNSTSTEKSKKTEVKLTAILQKIADFSITGKGSTNLFFGGKVVGESAMNHLEDIGSRVIHRYYLDNRGQWDLPRVKVNIQWPYQVRPGRNGNEGKWLLYLESMPEVLGSTTDAGTLCYIANTTEEIVNPLKLDLLTPSVDEPENLLLPPEFRNENDSLNNVLRRKRREVESVIESQEVEKGGIKRRITVMDCKGSARCVDIECLIGGLKKQMQVYVEIKSRIWNATLVEDYSNVDWVQINSHAQVEILDKTFITKPEQIFGFSAETLVYPEIIPSYSKINWWIIGGAVLAGVLLLILLVAILHKCGFFKRKRAKDQTLSGNLQKSSEESHTLIKPN